ncbi:hypothetical protein [Deinococcus radiopugnans]|uniref:hypothetical protein n=1 Tax=Deinococcus radiopugnans TaxID=57497 RepID=UPI0012E012D9|nr:hypothetical protein [Deinococcus radiopugnans]
MLGKLNWVEGSKHREASYEFAVDGQPVVATIKSREPSSMCSGFGASATFDLNGDNQDIYATGNTPEDAIHSVQEKMDRWLESVSNSSLK